MKSRQFSFVIEGNCCSFMSIEVGIHFINFYAKIKMIFICQSFVFMASNVKMGP